MKPKLLLGLGNVLMGDDGVGAHLARRLARHERLPGDVDVIEAGTDLLSWSDEMRGREHVLLVDALLDGTPAGTLMAVPLPDSRLDARQRSTHQLSAIEAVSLLRALDGEYRQTRFTVLAVAIDGVRAEAGLSPTLQRRMPALTDRILQHLR